MKVQAINNEVVATQLPKVGTLKNGSTASAYYLLDEATLADEGWLPLEDILPEYNEETEYLSENFYTISLLPHGGDLKGI